MEEYRLNVAVEVIEAELEHFYHDSGGIMLLPRITKIETQSNFVKYELNDESSVASLTLRPVPKNGCNLSIYFNDSERYAWLLGVPGRSELDFTTKLGTDNSDRCLDFCSKFTQHLGKSGYLVMDTDESFIRRPNRCMEKHNFGHQKEVETWTMPSNRNFF